MNTGRLVKLTEAALVVAIAYFAALFVWTWLEPGHGSGGFGGEGRHPAGLSSETSGDYRLLSRFDPFHRETAAVASLQPDAIESAPETTLALELLGIRATSDPEVGSAIIKTPDKKQRAFGVGQPIMPNVELARVFRNHVVISRHGLPEALYFEGEGQPTRTNGTLASRSQPTLAPQSRSVSRSLRDAMDLFAEIQLRPRRNGRRVEGYFLQPRGDGTRFATAGFAPGDVLLAVNGNPIVNGEHAMELIEELKGAEQVTFEVERGGKKQSLRLEFNQ